MSTNPSTPTSRRSGVENQISRLIVADPSLYGFSGHYYEYARAVGSAATRVGIDTSLVGNVGFGGDSPVKILPHFRLQTYDLVESFFPTPLRMMLTARTHAKDLKAVRRKFNLNKRDIVLMPTVSLPVLFGILFAFWFSFRPVNRPTVAVVLRDTMKIHRPAVKTLTSLFFTLARLVRASRWLQVCVDTEELKDEYQSVTRFPITVLPIPVERESISRFDKKSSENRLTISMLGDARLGKGIAMIPDLVETLIEQYPGKLKFIIQTSTPAVGAESELLGSTLDRLQQLEREQDGLVLLPEPLTTHDYFSTLAKSQIVLLPYGADSYRYQSSGMFAEAMALGKTVVVPADTWMSRELEQFSGGGEAFEPGNTLSLLTSTRLVIDGIEKYERQAQSTKLTWLAKHNSEELVTELLRSLP